MNLNPMQIKRPVPWGCAVNTIEAYANAGGIAGSASRRRDYALAGNLSAWLVKALALEPETRRRECRAAYDNAYREAAKRW